MHKTIKKTAEVLCLYLLFATAVCAQEYINVETDGSWPREIKVPEGVVVIYQPQPEALNGNLLKGRAAVAVAVKSINLKSKTG